MGRFDQRHRNTKCDQGDMKLKKAMPQALAEDRNTTKIPSSKVCIQPDYKSSVANNYAATRPSDKDSSKRDPAFGSFDGNRILLYAKEERGPRALEAGEYGGHCASQDEHWRSKLAGLSAASDYRK